VFLNPLLAAHGRAQIANQFIMAFALPGMDVTSELRDVICSDFEFGKLMMTSESIHRWINCSFLSLRIESLIFVSLLSLQMELELESSIRLSQ